MTILRAIVIGITSPVWIFAGVIIVPICVVGFAGVFIAMCVQYGFTGEWDW